MATQTAPNPPMFLENDLANRPADVSENLRAVRWLIFAGDMLTPQQKRIDPNMVFGGINFGHSFPCLAATRGLLRRCELTPLIVGYDFINPDLAGVTESDSELPAGLKRISYTAKAFSNWKRPEDLTVHTQYGYERLPGSDFNSIMAIQQGEIEWGIREVRSLYDVDPLSKSGAELAQRLQYEIFPDWAKYVSGSEPFFATASELRKHLTRQYDVVSEQAAEIVGLLLDSLHSFEQWGTRELDKQSRLVKAPITQGGRAYGFEPLHVQLFEQLELNREEFLMKREDAAPAGPTNVVSREEFSKLENSIARLAELTANGFTGFAANSPAAEAPAAADKAAVPSPVPAAKSTIPEDAVCAGLTVNGDPCKGKVRRQVAGAYYCMQHPK